MLRLVGMALIAYTLLAPMATMVAQPPDWSSVPPSMGLSFDPLVDEWADRCGSVSGGFQVITIYLMAPVVSDLRGWEASIRVPDPSTGWTVLNFVTRPEDVLNLLQAPSFIVGLGGAFDGTPHYQLVRFDMVYTAAEVIGTNDVLLCVADAHPESAGTRPSLAIGELVVGAEDMWCDAPSLDSDCAILNPINIACPADCSGVPIETRSFGAIKAKF